MNRNLYTLALVALMVACGDSDTPSDGSEPPSAFIYLGLAGLNVVALEETESTLIAATNGGIYKYLGEADWALVSPKSWSISEVTALYPSHLLASVQTQDGEFRLVESLNSGDYWAVVANNFGGSPDEQSEPIKRMVFDDTSGDLFATGYDVLARSDDFGRSWFVVSGDWQGFATGMSALTYSSQHGDFWFGGQGAIENARLLRTDRESGESTDLSVAVSELLESPSTVKSVVFYPSAEQTVFVSGEGGILSSTNYGTSWSPTLVNDSSRFYFDVVIDDETGIIYTGGWDKNFDSPQPLILEVSDDSGTTWQSFEYQDAAIQGGIWSLRLAQFGPDKRFFVGLQGGGVYEIELDRLRD